MSVIVLNQKQRDDNGVGLFFPQILGFYNQLEVEFQVIFLVFVQITLKLPAFRSFWFQ